MAFQFNCMDPLLGTTLYCTVSFADCHNSRKRVWCSEQHFLSQGVGPMRKKYHNCILHLNFMIAQNGNLMGTSYEVSLFYSQFSSNCKRLCLFHNLIQASSSESDLTPCDKKSCSEHHQALFCALVRGSGALSNFSFSYSDSSHS